MQFARPFSNAAAQSVGRGSQSGETADERCFHHFRAARGAGRGCEFATRLRDRPLGGPSPASGGECACALQPREWQGIPRALQQDITASSASFAYRLVEPAFSLTLKLERHEATKLLAARVNNITFTSVIADSGAMLTQVRLEILPGDKRLLHFTLPKDARFWFAFVNQKGVWPWREKDEILIPLEQQSRGGRAVPVEIFSAATSARAARAANRDRARSICNWSRRNSICRWRTSHGAFS